ncbi:hypothetical protein HDU67_008186 [Dinochytrium kinnereticum]|nr:hypothetical protein HDU67_008186 [Dinochytrium kinnereticum]
MTAGIASSKRNLSDALNELDDRRISNIRPVIPPQLLMEDFPLSDKAALTVAAGRFAAESIIRGKDDRLLVIVGPCSIHDVKAAKEYGTRLKAYADLASNELVIVMRVYFEKPRTTVGWKGLINDPFMDNTFQINKGLKLARGLLLDLNELGIPAGVEYLDTISPQSIGDLVTWGAIGARTVESQVHRELASGLSVPIGFKNGTDGNLQVAIDAIRAASISHSFLSVTKQGLSAIVETSGNDSCHVILRGGSHGPNYDADSIKNCVNLLKKYNLEPTVMVDCSHGNSQKLFKRQVDVTKQLCEQIASAESGTSQYIRGVMIESHLVEGRQDIPKNPADLPSMVYGQSVTDACISWEDTVGVLDALREAVRRRRNLKVTLESESPFVSKVVPVMHMSRRELMSSLTRSETFIAVQDISLEKPEMAILSFEILWERMNGNENSKSINKELDQVHPQLQQ